MGRHCARRTCPFCGWHYSNIEKKRNTPAYRPVYYAVCCGCRARGPEATAHGYEEIPQAKAEASRLWDAQEPIRLDRHGEADGPIPEGSRVEP